MAVIYLIRHAQASWGNQNYDELSELGIEQSKVLGATLRQRIEKPDVVITGTMRRHRQTAEHTLTAIGLASDWLEDSRWNEYDHEQLLRQFPSAEVEQAEFWKELMVRQDARVQFQKYFDQALRRWVSGEHEQDYPESWQAFRSRIADALQQSIENAGVTLVFTSGGAISTAVAQLWDLSPESWLKVNRVIANASITKLIKGKQGVHLSTFNEHHHFEGPGRRLLTYR